ncbi:MAG: cysteine desulfurase [Candidatus Tectomicrobia bacterium]|uniref:cysteine desulfurase n=1 Tax=Tectimicrobiota bacterium TaxID=2528274 RepID=A0A932FWE5_UNCTE|nr:cysteine desulfurase [Candidatus Tectomicrobia bacterium]
MRELYLDNNATTPIAPEVREALLPFLDERYGNPSSLHRKGVEAERALKESRHKMAALLNVRDQEIIFTSGATESDNLALKGVARAYQRQGKHLVTTAAEHEAVLESCKALEEEGFEVTRLTPDGYGRVGVEQVISALRDDTVLVAVMHVNNELGTIYPIAEMARAVKRRNPKTLVFSDGAQAFGKLPVSLQQVDLYAISGHKIHAPKGVGALWVRNGVRLRPLLSGGGQERNLRPGTENVAGAVALAAAATLAYANLEGHRDHLRALKRRFLEGMAGLEPVRINSPEDGLETTANVAFPGVPAEVLLHALEARGVYVSTGSACSTRHKRHSHVLHALGLPEAVMNASLRFSFSRYNTLGGIDYALAVMHQVVPELRATVRG